MENQDVKVCDYLVSGGFGYDYPPEYCDLEVEQEDADYCPMHMRMLHAYAEYDED